MSEIKVTRSQVFNGTGVLRPFSPYYQCVGPDGTRFDNRSIVTLRDVLRRKYGRTIKIVETWKQLPISTPCSVCGSIGTHADGQCD